MSSASIGSVGSSFTDQEVDFELPNSEVDFNLCMGMTPSPLTNSQHDVPVPDDIAAFIEETFGSFGTDIQPLSTDDQSQGVTLQDALINTNSVTSCTDSSKPAEEVQVITLDDDDDVVEFSNKEPTDVAEPVDDKTQDVSLNLALGKTSKKVAPLFEVLDATLDDLAESVFSNQEDGWAGCKPVTQQRAEAVKNQEIAVNVSKQVTEELMPGYSNIELPGKRPVAKRKPKTVKKAVKKVVVPEELAPVTVEKPGPDATSSVSFQLSETGIPVFTIPLPTSAAKAARPKPSPVDLSSTTTTKRQKLRESQAAATKPKTQTPAKNKKKEPFDLQKIIKSFKSKRWRIRYHLCFFFPDCFVYHSSIYSLSMYLVVKSSALEMLFRWKEVTSSHYTDRPLIIPLS